MPLPLEDVKAMLAAAEDHARSLSIFVAVAVVDEGGHLQAMQRMDGAFPLSSQIAESKAVGAAVWQRDGAALATVSKDRPGFFDQVNRLVRMPLMPALGSVLIRRDGHVLGAVGVSGAAPEQDLECAQAALRAIRAG